MWMLNGGANFAPYAFVPLAILAAASFAWFRRGTGNLMMAVALPAFVGTALMFTNHSHVATAETCPASTARLRLMTANVLMSNQQLGALADDVLRAHPDIVAFQELHQALESFSPELANTYPYRVSTDSPWVTLASRYPLEDAHAVDVPFSDAARAPVIATANVNGERVTVLAIHIMPPLNAAANGLAAEQYQVLERQVAVQGDRPLLAIGDFNATPLSPPFAAFLSQARLKLAASGWNLSPTHFPTGHFALRIDHVLERGYRVCSEQVISLTGSDHRAVVVDVARESVVTANARP